MTARAPYWIEADLSSAAAIGEFECVPLGDRSLPADTTTMLRDATATDPSGPAIVYLPEVDGDPAVLSKAELLDRVVALGGYLHANGVGVDDRVALLMPTVPEAYVATWGVQAAAIALPVNWMLEPFAVAELLRAAGVSVVIAHAGPEEPQIAATAVAAIREGPGVRLVLTVGGTLDDLPEGVEQVAFEEALAAGHDRLPPSDPARIAALLMTGGTTGLPKLARHTHAGWVFSAWSSALMVGFGPGDVRLCATPTFHVLGILNGPFASIAAGGSIVLPSAHGWRGRGVIEGVFRLVERHRITHLPLLPTIIGQVATGARPDADLAVLRVVSSGSAPLSVAVAKRFEDLVGAPVVEGYGLTETYGVTTMNPYDGIVKHGSVGIRFPYQQVRVLRDRTDPASPAVPGETGEIVFRGPGVFDGYDGRASDTLPGDWIATGDLGSLDDDGYLWITGRSKDLIIRGGHNIDPAPIEEAFHTHPQVVAAAVVGQPDPYAGELPVAFVQLAEPVGVDELLAHVAARTPERAAIPKAVYVVDEIPRSSVGKMRKDQLRARAAEIATESASRLSPKENS